MDLIQARKCQILADEIADELRLSPAIYKAFCQIPREIFSPVKAKAYELSPQPLSSNQWISSPLTVAKMTLCLECEGLDNILEIGCGSGYQAAILSKLSNRIFSIERIRTLAQNAKEIFKQLGISNVHIRHDDGQNGWPSYGPYDRIIFSCACEKIPQNIFNQLKDGGILLAPIYENGSQNIVKFKKNNGIISENKISSCDFVPLLNGREN